MAWTSLSYLILALSCMNMPELFRADENCRRNGIQCYNQLLDGTELPDLLVNLETKEDIEIFCREKNELMKCVALYKNCQEEKDLNYYENMTKDLSDVHGYLCYESREEFEARTDCFKENHDEMKKCDGREVLRKQLLRMDAKDTCCAMENYHSCLVEHVASKCGFRAFELLSELVIKYFGSRFAECEANYWTEDCGPPRSGCSPVDVTSHFLTIFVLLTSGTVFSLSL